MTRRELAIRKTYDVLTDLYGGLKFSPYVNLHSYIKSRKLNQNTATVLIKNGIVELVKKGSKGSVSEYKWKGPKPSRDMAIRVVDTCSSIANPIKKKEETTIQRIKPITKPKHFNVSLGFLKFKVTPVY